MNAKESLDLMVKKRLRRWGQKPPGLAAPKGRDAWLRGRPSDDQSIGNPFLKIPGSDRLRTLPDGLWLNFGGTPIEPYVDILAVEACGTIQNLLDKRSRFAPSTHSLLAVCPVEWLLAPVAPDDATPRWVAARVFAREPIHAAAFPVRAMRVLYGLKAAHYDGFMRHQLPHAHEFFVPMERFAADDSDRDPELRALLGRTSVAANFLTAYRGSAAPDPDNR